MKIALLINPKHFKDYNTSAEKITFAEFSLHNKKNNNFATDLKIEDFGGLTYLTFNAEKITPEINEVLSKLSFVLGIFECNAEFLKPINKNFEYFVNNNISSLMKYSGKTNEAFTRLMLSVALASIENNDDICVLDPICGKGTTLFEALAHNIDCYGVEIAPKVVEESAVFLKKFLENDRLKFNFKREKFSGAGKSFKAEKFIFNITKTKENKNPRHFEVVAGNTTHTDKYFKKESFDIILGDLPYGVKHSNITNEKQNSFTRSPKELLEASLSAWKTVLKPNGVLVISWNTFLLKKEDFKTLLEKNGFEMIDDESYNNFEHRVDQAINRDFIVARKA